MITKESLRLGNHFYLSQVIELLEDAAVLRTTIGGHHHRVLYTELRAVVLDGNILRHTYGFTVREASGGLYCISGLCLLPSNGGWQVSSSQYPDTRTFHFLHELENTYFALRHRTLPLKPGSDPVEEVTFEGMAAELQIGNIVNGQCVNGGELAPIQVHELTPRGIIHSGFKAVLTANDIEIRQGLNQNDPMPYSCVSGIPLSPEWIQDLGFIVLDATKGHYVLGRFFLVLSGRQAILQQDNHNFGNPFQYVHQLQNLFSALTGEVLPLSDKCAEK